MLGLTHLIVSDTNLYRNDYGIVHLACFGIGLSYVGLMTVLRSKGCVSCGLHAHTLDLVTAPDPERFGRIVQTRRRQLGLTTVQVAEAGGPSKPTLHRIETGRVLNPDTATFVKLDAALEWTAGSAARAFDGGLPTPLTSREVALPNLDRPIVATAEGVMLATEVLSSLAEAVDSLGSDDPAAVEGATAALSSLVDRMLRAWITAQAETWKAHGTLQSHELLITRMLGGSLHRAPGPTATEDDIEDINYLRWLIGRVEEDATLEEIERWAARWENSQR